MVERDTGRSLVFRDPDHQQETLVTRLVHMFVEPGTVIISDKFLPYFNLNNVGYIDLMVNNSKNFVDPCTGALSSKVKRKLNATTQAKLPGYLDEFKTSKLCQEVNPGDIPVHVAPLSTGLSAELSLLSLSKNEQLL